MTAPAVRHQGAGAARLRATGPGERHDLRLRPHGPVRPAHRAPARRAELRHPAPLAGASPRPRHVRAQRHRHRRQGAGPTPRRTSRGGRWRIGWRSSSRAPMPRSASTLRPTSRARPPPSRRCRSSSRPLIQAGHAYAAAGDVYFDVRSWPAYGELTRQSLDAMEPAQDADPRGKRDPRDFALWKGAKRGRAGVRDLEVAVGQRAGRAGTSSAPRCRGATSGRSSTSTAAASTCASRTTRTSWPSRPRPATHSRATGCTTASSPSATRRCRSRSAISSSPKTCCASGIRWSCATRSPRPTTARASTSRSPRSKRRMLRWTASAGSCSVRSATLQDEDGDLRIDALGPRAIRRGDG